MAKEKRYDSSSIEVFEGLDGVRKHPAMYLGAIGSRGHYQCFKEIGDNGNDEVNATRGDKRLYVRFNQKTGFVIVADTGRGIPVDLHKKTKLSGVETVLTRLHAGAKSGKSSSETAYGKRKAGVHGVGASVVNALSEKMEVWTRRDGWWWHIAFAKGKTVSRLNKMKSLPKDVVPPNKWPKRGTIVRYRIDETVLAGNMEPGDLLAWCDLTRYFSAATIEVDIVGGETKVSKVFEPKTPQALLRRRLKQQGLTSDYDPIVISSGDVRLVMTWTGSAFSNLYGSVSASPTSGGTHMRGLEAAVKEAFEKQVKRVSKKGVKVDATVGMLAVLDVSVDQPSFEGQAKDRLASKHAFSVVKEAVLPVLKKWARRNKDAVKKIVEHAHTINKIDVDAKNKKAAARETRQRGGRLSFPKGFRAATSFAPEKRETYLVEGNSAGGTAKMACMPWQEVLPLRGKIANVVRDGSKALTNEVVQGIVTVTGYDLRNPQKKLRTGKLILLTDADHDGDHITVLLLAVIQKIMPELIEQGRVFIVDAPLFEAQSGDEIVLGNSLAEMQKKHGRLTKVNRMKGWGSCDAPLLKQVAFDPDSRRLIRVEAPSKDNAKEFELLMGHDTNSRKKLLELQ